jgi:hypothetical protein
MRYWRLLIVLLVVFSSGCMGGGGGEGITVDRITVEPQQIKAGNELTVNVEARNSGLLEGKVFPGEEGDNILTNYCPDYFKKENFDLTTSSDSEGDNGYNISQGDRIQFRWRLDQKDSARIPLPGYECSFRFEIPFNYSTRSFKQIQVLEDREVETGAELESKVSKGPLKFDMEVIGSSSDRSNTIIKGENTSLYITAYNSEYDGESDYRGVIEMGDIELDSRGVININEDCLDGTPVLEAGDEKIYRCDIEVKDSYQAPSSRGEVNAEVGYAYIRDLGSRSVRVSSRGQ